MNSLSYLHYNVYDYVVLKKSDRLVGAGALLSSAIIYATFSLLIRESSVMFSNSAQVAIRFAVAALLVCLFRLIWKRTLGLPKRHLLLVLALGAIFAGVVILFTISVNETKIANSVFLLYAGSIVASLVFGTVVLKEKLTIGKVVAIVIAICGLAMYGNNLLAFSIGVIAGFTSGLFDGVGNGIRKMLKGVDRSLVILYSYAVGAIVAVIVALMSGEQWISQVHPGSIIAMLVFVGLMIGISNLLLYGFQHFDVNVGTVILSCELVFATILGYVFFRESPTPQEVLGGVLIFIASILAVVDLPNLYRKLLSQKQ